MKKFIKDTSRPSFQNRMVWNLYIKNGQNEEWPRSVIPFNTYGY